MMLALAQSIQSDHVVINEALQSIGSLTLGELNWLRELQDLERLCIKIQKGEIEMHSADEAASGDLAFHKKLHEVRIVEKPDDRFLTLIALNKEKDQKSFTRDSLEISHVVM